MRETLAIVAALGGHRGWRWWFPLGVYVGVAALARIWFEAPFHGLVRVSTSAAEALLLATAVSCVVLWLAGRFALSLGHRRSVVCAVLVLTTLALPSLAIGAAQTAGWLEQGIVGQAGYRVLPLGADALTSGWRRTAGFLVKVTTVAMAIAMLSVLALRWASEGARPWMGALLSGLAVTAGTVAINQAGFPAISAWPALLLLLFLCAALWRVFKEVPV